MKYKHCKTYAHIARRIHKIFGSDEKELFLSFDTTLKQRFLKHIYKLNRGYGGVRPSCFVNKIIKKGAKINKITFNVYMDILFDRFIAERSGIEKEALRFYDSDMLLYYKEYITQNKNTQKEPREFLEYLFSIRFFEPTRVCLDYLQDYYREKQQQKRIERTICTHNFIYKICPRHNIKPKEAILAIRKFIRLLRENISAEQVETYLEVFEREHAIHAY